MYLPPWFAAALAALNSATPGTSGARPDQPDPVHMATDGQLFLSVDKIEEGAIARLVK